MCTVLIRVDSACGGGYVVKLCVDSGTDPSWVENPIATAQVADIPDSSNGDAHGVLDSAGLTMEKLLATGRYLHGLLYGGTIGAALSQVCECGSHRVMYDVRPAELRCLPWETMALDSEQLLFTDPDNPCARATLPFAESEGLVDIPVRMLVLVGDTGDALAHRAEIDSIHAGLRMAPVRWHVEALEEPSEQEFFHAYDRVKPHILHFIGHAKVGPGDKPVLLVNSATGSWKLTRFHIVNRLRAAPAPRIVVLNACHTADTRAAVSGVAGAFEELGAGAVISMLGELTSPSAARFSREFYTRLACCGEVDVSAAVANARRVMTTMTGASTRDWALVSLSLRVEPRQVLPTRLAVTDQGMRTFETRPGFATARAFVNRTRERRELLHRLDPVESPLVNSDLHIFGGPPGVGKSTLVRCLLHTLHARGHRVVYVDLGGERGARRWSVEFGRVLLRINEEIAEWLPQVAAAPCRRFADDLAYLERGEEPPGPGAGDGRVASGRFAPYTERANEFLTRIFGSFAAMLRAVSLDRPLVLALDRFISEYTIENLADGLLTPAMYDQLGTVRLVAVDSAEKVDSHIREPLRSNANFTEVHPFEVAHTERLFREFYALRGQAFGELQWYLTKAMVARGQDWGPDWFNHVHNFIPKVGGGR